MKTMKRSYFRITAAIYLSLIFTTSFAGGKAIQETFTWKYTINKDARITMENYDCNLSIHTWDKGETELKLIIDADTRSDEDAATLEKYLRELVFSNSPSSVALKSSFWENRTNIMNNTTMKLDNGKSINLHSFNIQAELWIPSGCRFDLNSKYSQVTMEDFAGHLTLDLYNDNFTGNKVSEDVEITDKYSTIELKDTKNIEASLYNSKLNAGNSSDLIIVSKYSRVSFASCGILTVTGYNDKYEIRKTGDVTFTAKYSDLKTESSGNLRIDLYNGNVITENAGDVSIVSKYSGYQFSTAGRCTITSAYNDKLTAGKLTSLDIDESKYTTFRIDNLTESVKDRDCYNDSFTVSDTGTQFSGLTLNGKYVKASLTIPKTTGFRFRANIKYADLDINESSLKPIVKIVDGSEVKYDAVKGTESEGMPVIEINGYEVNFRIIEK
jgi:hypothetical protein